MRVWIVSSSRVLEEKYLKVADDVSSVFVKRDYELLCGGIASSMMRKIYDNFQNNNKKVSCVTLECYCEEFICIEPIFVDSTFDRTKYLYEKADIIVFLPGGSGSFAEIFSSLEEYRTVKSNKKMILYNEDGFYDSLISMLENLVNLGFNEKSILDNFKIINTINELEKEID